MVALNLEETIHTIHISKELEIAAPLEITFESILAELGPENQLPDGTPFPMVLEARPGGRWYRETGNDSGHLWGHVQVIKPPKLIELCGPMFMSYPAVNFMQYRLHEIESGTRLEFTHRALGLIPSEHREGVKMGWEHALDVIRRLAEERAQAK